MKHDLEFSFLGLHLKATGPLAMLVGACLVVTAFAFLVVQHSSWNEKGAATTVTTPTIAEPVSRSGS